MVFKHISGISFFFTRSGTSHGRRNSSRWELLSIKVQTVVSLCTILPLPTPSNSWKLARWVPDLSHPSWPRDLPLCCARQQDWLWEQPGLCICPDVWIMWSYAMLHSYLSFWFAVWNVICKYYIIDQVITNQAQAWCTSKISTPPSRQVRRRPMLIKHSRLFA